MYLRKHSSWAIVTGEYPPQTGGVSDYTFLLAKALAAAGDEVHVFTPSSASHPMRSSPTAPLPDWGVWVHPLPGRFGSRALLELNRELNALKTRPTLLVQYVPNAFGMKAMNLPFCLWLRLRRKEPVWVMFHEVWFQAKQGDSLSRHLLGRINRIMASLVARSAQRVLLSIPAWEPLVREVAPAQTQFSWLPVFSNLPVEVDPSRVGALRAELGSCREAIIIGHFATYQEPIAACLRETFLTLLDHDARNIVLLLGRGSKEFAHSLRQQRPDLHSRIAAVGELPPHGTSEHLAACDLLLQPYPDGISARRGSAMAGLALGVPTVTNQGHLSEPLWRDSQAVALAAEFSPRAIVAAANALLADPERLTELRIRSRALYFETFHLDRIVADLRSRRAGRSPE